MNVDTIVHPFNLAAEFKEKLIKYFKVGKVYRKIVCLCVILLFDVTRNTGTLN